jgi:hypothetical protein
MGSSCLQAQYPPEEEKGAKRARRGKVNLEVKAIDKQDFINRLESELKATQDGAKNGRNRYIRGNTKHIDKDIKSYSSFVLEPGDVLVLESGSEIAHASLKPEAHVRNMAVQHCGRWPSSIGHSVLCSNK